MTIKMLKEMIKDYPDDARIYADDGDRLFEGNSEFVCIVSEYGKPNKIVFQSKADIDVEEEVKASLEYFAENNVEEKEALTELAEIGYTPEDFDDPEWAEEKMKRYNLI